MAVWDVGLVLAAYAGCRAAGADGAGSLLAATAAASLRTLYVAVRRRSLEGFSAVALLVCATGLGLTFLTGDERAVLAAKSVTTGAVALAFLASLATGRPAAFGVAKRFGAQSEDERARWDGLYAASPAFRRVYVVMTAVWAGALLAESLLRLPLVYLLPPDAAVPASSVLLVGCLLGTAAWSAWYGRRGERRAAAAAPRGHRGHAAAARGDAAATAHGLGN
ncbi:VC0807 family protein [Streptomyces hoynatensis]|uniref:DUF3159 domain-containing protein n=1 Tax=Streptomyces hoynatensis TaxID=1141874 RepID=A0A3A9Z402_9ACTN|nr:VC0807 family protein [Streptomyces hoynatensis]RKN43162.1 hypothetical protein D7294_11815 [Streptomyces hoynatensis]